MSIKPSVLILEKSSFPDHIALEECERLGKTPDQQDAIIRFQRPQAASKFEKVVRFFSDLLRGVTRAKGELVKQPDKMPEIVHIRGVRCEVKNINGRVSATRIGFPQKGGERSSDNSQFTELKVIVRENPKIQPGRQKALHVSMATQLEASFEAHDPDAGLAAAHAFLELAESKNQPLSPRTIVQLMAFSDALARNSLKIFSELTHDVQKYVCTTLQLFQDEIRQLKPPNDTGSGYAGFQFKLLANLEQQARTHEGLRANADSIPPQVSNREASAPPEAPNANRGAADANPSDVQPSESLPAQAQQIASGAPAASSAAPEPPVAPALSSSPLEKWQTNVTSNNDSMSGHITEDMLANAAKKLKPAAPRKAILSTSNSPPNSLPEILLNDPRFRAAERANQGGHDQPERDKDEWS